MKRDSRAGLSLLLNPPNLSRRDFLQNASHGVQIQIGNHSYQISKVIYKVTNTHLLFALFLSIFGNAIVTTLDFMQGHMLFNFVFHLVMRIYIVFYFITDFYGGFTNLSFFFSYWFVSLN